MRQVWMSDGERAICSLIIRGHHRPTGNLRSFSHRRYLKDIIVESSFSITYTKSQILIPFSTENTGQNKICTMDDFVLILLTAYS